MFESSRGKRVYVLPWLVCSYQIPLGGTAVDYKINPNRRRKTLETETEDEKDSRAV
jgi:hypothetical protein